MTNKILEDALTDAYANVYLRLLRITEAYSATIRSPIVACVSTLKLGVPNRYVFGE
jgi:hypothetical protein